MKNIKENALKTPALTAVIVALFAVAAFSLPVSLGEYKFSAKENAGVFFSVQIGVRIIACVIAAIYAKKCDFEIFCRIKLKDVILSLLIAVFVCLNNFPFIAVISGEFVLSSDFGEITVFILYCLSVGFAEEFVFRGVVLPLFLVKFKDNALRDFLAVLCSAAVFSLCHIGNLFGGAGIFDTALQIAYTFLTGGLFGAIFVFTENVLLPAVLHFIYDVGGLIFSSKVGIGSGNQWDTVTVIITAVLGVFATVYFTVKLLKNKNQSK